MKRILTVDVGGTKVKFLASGETEPRKLASGPRLTPASMVDKVRKAAKGWRYDAVSIGLPAMVGPGGPLAEPGNLGHGWVGFDFAAAFDCPVRIANDAAMQALGSYDGGRMLFLGFGTGARIGPDRRARDPAAGARRPAVPARDLQRKVRPRGAREERQEGLAQAGGAHPPGAAEGVHGRLRGGGWRQRQAPEQEAARRGTRGE
ncbi:MAG TPA: hypothetical protein VFZ81_11245 [Burkholderiales bacterium]